MLIYLLGPSSYIQVRNEYYNVKIFLSSRVQSAMSQFRIYPMSVETHM